MKPFTATPRPALPRLIAAWTAATILSAQAAGPTTPPTPPTLSTPRTPATATTPPAKSDKTPVPGQTGAKSAPQAPGPNSSQSEIDQYNAVYAFDMPKSTISYRQPFVIRVLKNNVPMKPNDELVRDGKMSVDVVGRNLNERVDIAKNGGGAEFTQIPANLPPGTYTLRAKIEVASPLDTRFWKPPETGSKNTVNYSSNSWRDIEKTLTLTVQKAPPRLSLDVRCTNTSKTATATDSSIQKFKCPLSSNLEVSGYLNDDGGPLDGRAISISYGSVKMADVSTDTSGKFSHDKLKVIPLGTEADPKVTVSFAGDTNHLNASRMIAIDYANQHDDIHSDKKIKLMRPSVYFKSNAPDGNYFTPVIGYPTILKIRFCDSKKFKTSSDCPTAQDADKSVASIAGVKITINNKPYVSDSAGIVTVSYVPMHHQDLPKISLSDPRYEWPESGTVWDLTDFRSLMPGPATMFIHDVPAKVRIGEPFDVRITLKNAAGMPIILNDERRLSIGEVFSPQGYTVVKKDVYKNDGRFTITIPPDAIAGTPLGKRELFLRTEGGEDYRQMTGKTSIEILPKNN